jgi:hypothetical protein
VISGVPFSKAQIVSPNRLPLENEHRTVSTLPVAFEKGTELVAIRQRLRKWIGVLEMAETVESFHFSLLLHRDSRTKDDGIGRQNSAGIGHRRTQFRPYSEESKGAPTSNQGFATMATIVLCAVTISNDSGQRTIRR